MGNLIIHMRRSIKLTSYLTLGAIDNNPLIVVQLRILDWYPSK